MAEVASLKVGGIDSKRMLIRIGCGKGGRCRYALLSADLLALLRARWQQGNRVGVMLPAGWLFPGQNPAKPITTRQRSRVVETAPRRQVGPSASARTLCGTAPPLTCSRTAGTFASSKSAMPNSTTLRSTPAWPPFEAVC